MKHSKKKSLIEDTKIRSFNNFSSLLAFSIKQSDLRNQNSAFFVFKTLRNYSSATNVIEMVQVKSDIFYFLCCSELIFFCRAFFLA